MVYSYKRKSTRGSWSVEDMMSAIRSVRNGGVAVREAVRRFHVPRATLQRHLKTGDPVPHLGFFKPVFTVDQEHQLAQHIQQMDRIFYGLTVEALKGWHSSSLIEITFATLS